MSGFTTVKNKFLRVFRLTNPVPTMIYGLYRKSIIDKIEIKEFDYWDVYLGLWFELNSKIAVIPMNLHYIGVNGVRIPYSVTGQFINAKTYLMEASKLFKANLRIVHVFILNCINFYLIFKTTKRHNRVIKKLITAQKV